MSQGEVKNAVETFFRIADGFRITQMLYTVAKLGVADLLTKGSVESKELARNLGVQARPLFRVMRALASLGFFTQDTRGRFGLTSVGHLLCTDDPRSMRHIAIYFGEESYRAAGELLHTVKTGETAFDSLYGKPHFDYLGKHPEASETFNAFMAESARRFENPFGSYGWNGRRVIVDVGGGRGTLLTQILLSGPALNGILYDLPQGVKEAPPLLSSEGVADRCKIVTGSFFDSVPSGGDVYLLSRILHDWPDEKAKLILRNCRKAMGDKGILLIRETVIPEGDTPSEGKLLDVTMLFMLGGAERTENEWRALLVESRFELTRIVRTGYPFDLIEAKPI